MAYTHTRGSSKENESKWAFNRVVVTYLRVTGVWWRGVLCGEIEVILLRVEGVNVLANLAAGHPRDVVVEGPGH